MLEREGKHDDNWDILICRRDTESQHEISFFIYGNGANLHAPQLFHQVPAISHQHMYRVTMPTKV